MNKYLALAIAFVALNISMALGQRTVVTAPENVLTKQEVKYFTIVDTKYNYVLGKECKPFTNVNEANVCFFTDHLIVNKNALEIHMFDNASNNLALQDNTTEKAVFFSKARLIAIKSTKIWTPIVDDHCVIFRNKQTNAFLTIDAKGNLSTTRNIQEASRWELIRNIKA